MTAGPRAGAAAVGAARLDVAAQPGVHCETTTLRNLLSGAGVEVSEAMLFGLGEGIDFEYHEVPGRAGPMFLTGRDGPSELIRNACTALGVDWEEEQPADAEDAMARTAELVGAGHAVGVTVDIFHLDYFASRVHFSAHCVAVIAVGPDTVTVVDTTQQGGVQTLPTDSLRRARASDKGYMPSPYRQFHVRPVPPVWSQRDLDVRLPGLAWEALSRTMDRVLANRGPLLGPAGLRRCADEAPQWETLLPRAEEQVAEFGRFSDALAHGALMGARGDSGVVLVPGDAGARGGGQGHAPGGRPGHGPRAALRLSRRGRRCRAARRGHNPHRGASGR